MCALRAVSAAGARSRTIHEDEDDVAPPEISEISEVSSREAHARMNGLGEGSEHANKHIELAPK